MGNLVQSHATNLLVASLNTASYTAPTTPIKLALDTANGTATTAGTEVSGGSYARQTIAFTTPAAASTSNSASITYTNMPAATTTGVELFDSSVTPARLWYGALTTNVITASGDTLSFASGAVIVQLA